MENDKAYKFQEKYNKAKSLPVGLDNVKASFIKSKSHYFI
jgi:hypothetical protein